MNHLSRITRRANHLAKLNTTMREHFRHELKLVLSGQQRLDFKIDALQISARQELKEGLAQMNSNISSLQAYTKEEIKLLDSRITLLQASMKEDMDQLDSKIDSLRSETKTDLFRLEEKIEQKFASKADLLAMEQRQSFHYATKDNLAQTKMDLIKWMFTFWASIVLMLLGLYLKK
jgi:hypothetical protein